MAYEILIKQLKEKYNVIRNTDYHFQIIHNKGKHDFWISNCLRWRLTGNHGSKIGSKGQFLRELEQYDFRGTDVGKIDLVLELTKTIREAQIFFSVKKIDSGIFVDAGVKLNKARIAAVYVTPEEIKTIQRMIPFCSTDEAESRAIVMGMAMNPFETVFSDSKMAVEKICDPRVVWISRNQQVADRLANLRGK